MKILTITVTLCCVYQVLAQANECSNTCRNVASNPLFCVFASSRCDNPVVRLTCALTCKSCTPCDQNVARSPRSENTNEDCEIEDCVDLAPPDQCLTITNVIPNGCSLYPQSCRLSCGQCRPCPIPDPVPPCSLSCEDFGNSCEHWQSKGYCNKSSEFYPFTSQECPRSCGLCEQCPTPSPLNTALPPTELVCTNECEDVDENCGFWKEEGYCNQTEEFPQLQETCPLSCGVCKRCPAEEPTPPPCSQDCSDSNENCDFWEEQGYCSEDSEFPRVREVCHKSCGVCTPCPSEDQSTALPPTREEAKAAKNNK